MDPTSDCRPDRPRCGKCGVVMTQADSRLRPELFLHDACLPEELKPPHCGPHRDYLGDGVYVDVENGMVKLIKDGGLTNTIYLEIEVYAALLRYVARMNRTGVLPMTPSRS
jgi:hypothetical protein